MRDGGNLTTRNEQAYKDPKKMILTLYQWSTVLKNLK
jgi:hypothetical protein